MQRWTGELRQGRKAATVTRIPVCRRVPGHIFPLASYCSSVQYLCSIMATGYQVIARRWRPQQFDELVGQDHISRTIKNAIEKNRIAHAYLFVGPRGTGKTSMARLFAKALNCEDGPIASPPNDSPICQEIMNGSCMDVIEIDGASNNSVDQVRQLREDCQYAPAVCRYKIYIIDEVHMLSNAAFNALLKTLEEPPAHVKFVFATTEAQKVLPTIVSRCQRFEFRPIPDKVIADKLRLIAKKEGITVEDNAIQSIAILANGGMRDAQSILDQMISFCGDDITDQDVLDVYGLVSMQQIQLVASAIATANYAELVALVDSFASEGRDLYRVLVNLQAYIREILLDSIRNNGTSNLLGHDLTTESLMRLLESLHAGEALVQRGLSEKVNFEVTLLKAVDASRTRAIDTVIRQLQHLANDLPQKGDEIEKKNDDLVSEPEKLLNSYKNSVEETKPVLVKETKAHSISANKDKTGLTKTSQTNSGQHNPQETSPSRHNQIHPETKKQSDKNLPPVQNLKDEIPESTRELLRDLLKGEFREVTQFDSDEIV